MKVIFSLAVLYIKSFINLPSRPAKGQKRDVKSTLKTTGIIALVIFLVADVGFLFVMMNIQTYNALAPLGLQDFLMLNVAAQATIVTLLFGFIMCLSSYYLNDMEQLLLALPLKPKALLTGKFIAVYAMEAVFALALMFSMFLVFGIKEQPPVLFYVWGLIAALLIPLPPLAVSYAILIPLMRMNKFMRNKKILVFASAIMGVVLALGFNVYIQGSVASLEAGMTGMDSFIEGFAKAYPPSLFAWRALSSPLSLQAPLSILYMALSCFALPVLLVLLFSGTYVQSLIGFSETHIRKIGSEKVSGFISKNIRKTNCFITLVKREFVLMNREPMYLLNGPFLIILLPLIFIIMYYFGNSADVFSDLIIMAMGSESSNNGFIMAVCGLITTFLGSGTSIACTALSRDAKSLPFIKSLPLDISKYMWAKFVHAMIFVLVADVMVLILMISMGLGISDIAGSLVIGTSLSALLHMVGLWLDTANPKLSWENPIGAMKQNVNTLIMIFSTMFICGGIGYVAYRLAPGKLFMLGILGLIPVLLTVVLALLYNPWVRKRMLKVEC